MNHQDCMFIAEKQLVEIVPNFRADVLRMCTGNFGPFEPGVAVRVPLWLAAMLKQRRNCGIVLPEWMSIEHLEEIRENERSSPLFTQLPNEHFFEVSTRLLNLCVLDAVNNDQLKTLLLDIKDLRMAKLKLSMEEFLLSDSAHAAVNNLTMLEICTIREFLSTGLHQIRLLLNADEPEPTDSFSSSF
uniref:DNA replication complex GINS protein PSF2 n=1 Tax=Trichuris muris TaxID=70415 RepID=A0A5S6QVF2_TRIMR